MASANWDIVKGKWNQMKGGARDRWGKLTDDDLQRVNGQRDKLVGLIEERYGKARKEVEKEVDAWCKECGA